MVEELVARGLKVTAESKIRKIFSDILKPDWVVDALFADSGMERVMGVANLPLKAPVMLEILNNHKIARYLEDTIGDTNSYLIVINKAISHGRDQDLAIYFFKDRCVELMDIPANISRSFVELLSKIPSWAGYLNDQGEHIIDLRSPLPGPHFAINLLLGNRIGFPHALQTTPKSVVDRLGRGSFRSHAASQVLATRWDVRQEENGFPANRQFYLVEEGRKIFYSADPNDSNLEKAFCIHSQNKTTISYETKCGLEIKRVIFLLAQEAGLPLATEVQKITIHNLGDRPRQLKLVYTGMFGPAFPNALQEDVLYSNIIMQSKLLKNEDGSVMAVGVEYRPENAKEDLRFHAMIVNNGSTVIFPREFCCNYNEFVGNGTLENPGGLYHLSNNLYRKGPGFFALAAPISLFPGGECSCDNFTGLVSKKNNPYFQDNTFKQEIENLIGKFSKPGELAKTLEKNERFYQRYCNFLQVKSADQSFNQYCNKNLPFQVLYQTIVSRSFCQTQKGYREIGFREIQDIYATMYYFVSMGMKEFVKDLLKEWCGKIFEFGYAYHNFFWVGKEPGKWSDDALWFVQALYRYINLTGDRAFLDEECEIAGTDPVRTRPVYETAKAILVYSGEISIGKHGMPLLDYADWNDCLKLDDNFVNGVTKEKLYREQIAKGGNFGEPLRSDYSESVMNAFLLKLAIDEMMILARDKNDREYDEKLKLQSSRLYDRLQTHAWKGDFFARVLFNRFQNNEYIFLGAKGDGLSADPKINGAYFLNSLSWAILSDSASEEQIRTMLTVVMEVLKTPFGLKLVSSVDLGKIAQGTATGEYFPGDRENGAIFKHACMMATVAMFKAAKQVPDLSLAEKLTRLAYWMLELVLPYKTMVNPFVTCGNPRFCTQYNNSETGENIGPMLSGTSTWLTLSLLSALGIEYTRRGIEINPLLQPESQMIEYTLNTGGTIYWIQIQKPLGFYRIADRDVTIQMDGRKRQDNILPLLEDGQEHRVEIVFKM